MLFGLDDIDENRIGRTCANETIWWNWLNINSFIHLSERIKYKGTQLPSSL